METENEFNKLVMEDKDFEELFIMGENFSENVLKLNDLLIYLCNNVMLIDKEKSIKLMNFTKDKLIKSIQNVSKGKKIESKKPASAQLEGVTDSQLETMRLIAQGKSNKEIAKNRKVTEKSVEQTISRLVATFER